IGRILLYYETLGLGGSIPELRHLQHRPVPPTGHDIGGYSPFDGTLGCALRYQCADDVPAVVEVDAPVDQLEPPRAFRRPPSARPRSRRVIVGPDLRPGAEKCRSGPPSGRSCRKAALE